jgi:hypothetical protein
LKSKLSRTSSPWSGRERITRLAALVVLVVAGFVGGAIVPLWIRTLLGSVNRAVRRQATTAFLDVLLVLYVVSLISSIALASVLVYFRLRGRARCVSAPASRLQAKLLLLSTSVLVSLVVLEAGAAGWRLWLHRSPRLSVLDSGANTAGRSGVPLTGTAPYLPVRLPTRDPGGNAGRAPLRIVVIGESSGRGEPYHPRLSVAQIAAWRLEQVFPGRQIEVEIWALGGAVLEAMHNKLADLTYRPDAIILYIGHNEFQGRFAWMRDVDYYRDSDQAYLAPVPEVVERSALLRFSPLGSLIMETRERQRLDTIPPRNVTRELVDRPACSAAEAASILADFGRRLDEIATYCETIGTLSIFVIPASNDGDYDPSRSVLAADTPRSERAAFAREVVRARSLEKTHRTEAIRIYRELVRSHPEFAETHYRLARLLEQSACWLEARDHYIQARERDGMPLRCPEPFRQAFRDVAARHPAVLLVDGPKVLEAKSLHGILDGRFFHDAQHPNLAGYVALAEDLLNQLGARRAFGWPAWTPAPLVVPEACAIHFGIGAAEWKEVCRHEAAFFQATAYIRHDPEFRNERAVAYLQAYAALQEGRDPSLASIPGWPMPPKLPASHHISRGQRVRGPWSENGDPQSGDGRVWSVVPR